ncbi:hypothetical protein D777_01491 [Marinobacter nitratireducens]|uniref:Uncharacterized protein n=1 Tax=Marinobacter nitratireducens TaxID=1137280 RepID=A0A072NFC3_9GAMM|nr:hypothetical protein D777_01491 [Marinobacter nitratireducens]
MASNHACSLLPETTPILASLLIGPGVLEKKYHFSRETGSLRLAMASS